MKNKTILTTVLTIAVYGTLHLVVNRVAAEILKQVPPELLNRGTVQ